MAFLSKKRKDALLTCSELMLADIDYFKRFKNYVDNSYALARTPPSHSAHIQLYNVMREINSLLQGTTIEQDILQLKSRLLHPDTLLDRLFIGPFTVLMFGDAWEDVRRLRVRATAADGIVKKMFGITIVGEVMIQTLTDQKYITELFMEAAVQSITRT